MRGMLFECLYMNVSMGFDSFGILEPSFCISKGLHPASRIHIQHRLKYWVPRGIIKDAPFSPKSVYNLAKSTQCVAPVASTQILIANNNVLNMV